MTPDLIRAFMDRLRLNPMNGPGNPPRNPDPAPGGGFDPIWWATWHGPDSGGGPGSSTGGRKITLFGDPGSSLYGTSGRGDPNPNAPRNARLINSEASPFLKAAGLSNYNADQLLFNAAKGNFTFGINPATGLAALKEGALPWSNLPPDAVRALMDIQIRGQTTGGSRRFVLTGENTRPKRRTR